MEDMRSLNDKIELITLVKQFKGHDFDLVCSHEFVEMKFRDSCSMFTDALASVIL